MFFVIITKVKIVITILKLIRIVLSIPLENMV